ncbi:regulatory protein, tetR family [Amycolatopsis xylanica]|uniref:Regulatory protein, tetR family n=2 Tax=Amycolatopsis xylanica TaxID=589385 RepID=A0A1H3G6A7_9PSEU|nr:regulatory protein, tetR family [Amycolatopsis xylanica]
MSALIVSTSLTRTRGADNVVDMAPRVPYAEAAKVLLRDTLLNAASDLLREKSWQDLKMGDIATAAGVSRQTLYKEFRSRQLFAEAYILRETEVFLAAVEEAIVAHVAEPREALAAALEVFLTAAAEEPLIKAIVAGDDSDGLLSTVTNHAGPILHGSTVRLTEMLVKQWPDTDHEALNRISRYLVRLAVSYAASPDGTPAEIARETVTVLGPYLDEVLGG